MIIKALFIFTFTPNETPNACMHESDCCIRKQKMHGRELIKMHIGAHKNEWGSAAVNIVGSHPVGVGVRLLYTLIDSL